MNKIDSITDFIDITQVNLDNIFLHFTEQGNMASIFHNGLLPKIGKNAQGIEMSEKIFFAKGATGALQIFDVWIKWIIKNMQYRNYLIGTHDEQYYYMLNKFNEDFLNGKLYEDEKIKKEAFDYMIEYMKNNCYLVLNLEENIDFRYDDIDEAKLRANQNGTRENMNVLYGNQKYDLGMEAWNMHTISGKIIEPEKLKILKNGYDFDSLSIIKEIYNLTNRERLNINLLDEFINYLNMQYANENNIGSKR